LAQLWAEIYGGCVFLILSKDNDYYLMDPPACDKYYKKME
jgi:hypothetical protein